ncbi:MAG: galactose mutarotase [Clostridia bacterium]|nr:galactose mutarotase [Clostridia bacterium]
MSVKISDFGVLANGTKIQKYTIENSQGTSVSVITYGATLISALVADRNGVFKDVIVGFDDLEGCVERTDYQGVVVGPYANRIGNSEFSIDGIKYKLNSNENGVTCLHSCGEFNTAVWNAELADDSSVEMSYVSPDGVNGFPGRINVSVKYTLTDDNELKLEYSAVSDKKTVINLTNHAYFNLGGFDSGLILDHTMQINADCYTPVDELSIPTGEIASVENTPFDLRTAKRIGDEIDADCEQLKFTGGYDHNFCISGYDGTLKTAAVAFDSVTGRKLEVLTDLPGIQFYAGNFLKGTIGKSGKPMEKRSGFCLETQFYPDTPNHPDFPQCTFEAGEKYHTVTVFKFSAE